MAARSHDAFFRYLHIELEDCGAMHRKQTRLFGSKQLVINKTRWLNSGPLSKRRLMNEAIGRETKI